MSSVDHLGRGPEAASPSAARAVDKEPRGRTARRPEVRDERRRSGQVGSACRQRCGGSAVGAGSTAGLVEPGVPCAVSSGLG